MALSNSPSGSGRLSAAEYAKAFDEAAAKAGLTPKEASVWWKTYFECRAGSEYNGKEAEELFRYLFGQTDSVSDKVVAKLSFDGVDDYKVCREWARWGVPERRLLAYAFKTGKSRGNKPSHWAFESMRQAVAKETGEGAFAPIVAELKSQGVPDAKIPEFVREYFPYSYVTDRGAVTSVGRWMAAYVKNDFDAAFMLLARQTGEKSWRFDGQVEKLLLVADMETYGKIAEKCGLVAEPDENLATNLKSNPQFWLPAVFKAVSDGKIEHVVPCAVQIEKLAPGKLRPALEAFLLAEAGAKGGLDCHGGAKDAFVCLAKRYGKESLKALKAYRENNLAWRLGALKDAAKAMKGDALPVLEALSTPESLKGSYQMDEKKFLAEVAKLVVACGGTPNVAPAKDPVKWEDVLAATKGKDFAQFAQEYAGDEKDDWQDRRERLEKLADKVLAKPEAVAHKDWAKVVQMIVDQTVDFGEYTEGICGETVDPLEDEGGFAESYSDGGMCTGDIVFALLAKTKDAKPADISALAKAMGTKKAVAFPGMSWEDDVVSDFFTKKHVKALPDLEEVKKAVKKGWGYARI